MTGAGYITIASLIVNLIIALIALKIRSELSKTEISMERKIEQGHAALMEKIREVELFTRDNFVRRETFTRMAEMMTTQMQAQFDRLYGEMTRLNDKLDRVHSSNGG